MSTNEFRRLAAKIDQHMQQLAAEGVGEAHAIINRMMGYVPDLHRIWVGTSDPQLMALSHEFPGFYRYALIMEEASEAERNKASRPYDNMVEFTEEHKQQATQLLVTAATLERGYQAFRGSGNLQVFQPEVNALKKLQRHCCPILITSKAIYARRVQNRRYWSAWTKRSDALPSASNRLLVDQQPWRRIFCEIWRTPLFELLRVNRDLPSTRTRHRYHWNEDHDEKRKG